MTSAQFWVDGIPVQQGSKSIIKGRMVEAASDRLKPWRTLVAARARQAYFGVQCDKKGAFRVALAFYFPRPKKHFRTGKFETMLRNDAPIYMVKTPDLDKLTRAVGDAITQSMAVWRDDAQVAHWDVQKRFVGHNGQPGVMITIDTLEEEA